MLERSFWLLFSQAGSGAGDAPPPMPSAFESLFPFIAIAAIMFFVILLPDRKREKEKQQQLSLLKKNDRIVTTGGIHGVVHAVKDDVIILKVDEERDVKLTISRSAVAHVSKQSEPKASDDSAKST